MKFKKALVVILALAMVVTLMPTMAFATTSNTVSQTYTVATDTEIPTLALNMKVTNVGGIDTADTTKFSLNLTNAEFQTFGKVGGDYKKVDDADITVGPTHAADTTNIETVNDVLMTGNFNGVSQAKDDFASIVIKPIHKDGGVANKDGEASGNSDTDLVKGDYTLTSASSTKATLEIKNLKVNRDGYITLMLNLKSGSEDGEVKVAVDGLDSKISSGTYTVATVNSNNTKAKVTGDVKTHTRGNAVKCADVEIQESAVNSITGNQLLKLSLPRDFEWNKDTEFGGDLLNANSKKKLSGLTEDAAKPTVENHYWIDGKNLYVYLEVSSNINGRQNIMITPVVNITKDAAFGDIALSISTELSAAGNDIDSASDLIIGKYGEETVEISTVEEKDLPQIVAGYEMASNDKEFYVQVTIKESVKGSLTKGRDIDFDLNDEVQIADTKKIKYYVGSKYSNKKYSSGTTAFADSDISGLGANKTKDRSEFSWEVAKGITNWKSDEGNTITFFIPVTAKPGFTGDVKLNIKGAKAGIEEKDIVVGKVIAPVTVETKVTKVINGAQKQALADIIIKENVPGYLKDDTNKDTLSFNIDTLGLTNGFALDNAKVEVTEGNIEVKSKIKYNADQSNTTKPYDNGTWYAMAINVKESSTKASTIKISGVTASLSRLLPEGEYALEVYGPAVEDNTEYNKDAFNVAAIRIPYVNVATSADTQQAAINSTFVIGSTTSTVNGTDVTMDVAPFIDGNNRTMVPIRYVANALGVTDENITYNNASTTATISGRNNVVNVTTGSNTLVCSTGNIMMDTVAVNSNGRLYVPVRFIANALGAQVSWDPTTKTVTVFTASK